MNVTLSSTAEKVSFSIPPTSAAVEGVGEVDAELPEVEVIDAVADLLVDREADPCLRPCDLGMSEKPFRRGHDLGHSGLVVGAEERLPVRGDDVVPDPLAENTARGRGDLLPGIAG